MNKKVGKKQVQRFQKWYKNFLVGTDKDIIRMWFDDYKLRIKRVEGLAEEYEEEKIILALCYIDGLSKFKNGRTSKKLFIAFLSIYAGLDRGLATKLYEWHRCFGVHHGKILGISRTGNINLNSNPPQITSHFILKQLKNCFNKLRKEMS